MTPRPANPALAEDILHAAQRIIEECGPECVTMRQVAEEIGYSPTTIYLYYKDKKELLSAALVHGFEELADFANEAMVGPGWIDKARQRSRAYVVWGLTHPNLYRLMFEGGVLTDELISGQAATVTRGLTEGGKIMAAAIEAGEARKPDDPEAFGAAFWAALHGVTSLAITRRLFAGAASTPKAEYAARCIDVADTVVAAMLATITA